MSKTIDDLIQESHQIATLKGFWDKDRNIGELLMLITSELAEGLEADRKNRWSSSVSFSQETFLDGDDDVAFKKSFEDHIKDTFEDEMADVAIRLFDLCGGLGIDLTKHIEWKMRYNATRDRLNGKNY